MPIEKVHTLVVGGGQAGLAMSEHLRDCRLPHLVLERARIAESWRTRRWDSLVANGPAWHDRFPGLEFEQLHPDAFAGKDAVADYLESYARHIDAPVRTGVTVTNVSKNEGMSGFAVKSSHGEFDAECVVAATGPFQDPITPPIVPADARYLQLHSAGYRNPAQLPPGGVLVVGAGSSGVQIAEELLLSGRDVYLSVGPHGRPPRSYRQRDYCWWLGVLGKWDAATIDPNSAHVTISVSGARGGHTIDFRRLAAQGMRLVGMTASFNNGVVTFSDDLAANIAEGDASYLAMLSEADAFVERNGLNLPPEPEAHIISAVPDCIANPTTELDLDKAGVRSIIWATGYKQDFSWLQVDVFGEDGRPKHQRGVSAEPGIYFLGLPWLSRRGSSFIWGVWHDAKYLAGHINTRRQYMEYSGAAERITCAS